MCSAVVGAREYLEHYALHIIESQSANVGKDDSMAKVQHSNSRKSVAHIKYMAHAPFDTLLEVSLLVLLLILGVPLARWFWIVKPIR